jgi:hypothetical protein
VIVLPITYEPIATTTLGTAAATVTFSTITGSYTDLVLIAAIKGTVNDESINVRFNSDSGSNYSHTTLIGTGSSAVSQRLSNQTSFRIGNGNSDTNFDAYVVSINNYSNSTTYKTTIARENASSVAVSANVGLWRSTSAITAIEIFRGSGNLVAGSTFTLYGIKSA